MATRSEYVERTKYMGIDSDCFLCGASWGMCHGLCIEHTAAHGRPGPFHDDFNDDCEECYPTSNVNDVCLDPDKMHGAADGFPGEDFPSNNNDEK